MAKYIATAERLGGDRVTAAKAAYDEDVRRCPAYHDGAPRPAWEQLDPIAQWSWERNPTPREYRVRS